MSHEQDAEYRGAAISISDPRLRTAVDEVLGWAQATLTALNVGDVKSESLLHLKLRETMIEYREALAAIEAGTGE